jgi:uncharacterized membrane protein YidH (DUF202 family)
MREATPLAVDFARSLLFLSQPTPDLTSLNAQSARKKLSIVFCISVLGLLILPLAEYLVTGRLVQRQLDYPMASSGMAAFSFLGMMTFRIKWQRLERQGIGSSFDHYTWRLLLSASLALTAFAIALGTLLRSISLAWILALLVTTTMVLAVASFYEKRRHDRRVP